MCSLKYMYVKKKRKKVVFKICFKYFVFFFYINMSLEDLTGLFLVPKIFRKEIDNKSIIFLCTLLKMFC